MNKPLNLIKLAVIKILVGVTFFKSLNFKVSLRLARFWVKRYFLGFKIPGVAIIALTYKCQCKCPHCYAGAYRTYSQELTIVEWKDLIDELDILGVPRLHITGGEPTLKEGFEEVVKHACSKGMLTFLETNGYSVSEETILWLKEAGLTSIDISLDSVNCLKHDELRGVKNIFKRAINTIKLCKRHKINHMVSTYAVKEGIYSGELIKLILFAKKMRVPAIRILPPQPSGKWLNKEDNYLSREDRDYLRSRFPIYAILDRTTLPVCPIESNYSIFIAPDGEMQPCPHLPFSFGNCRSLGIAEALNAISSNPMFKKRSICFINDPTFRSKFIKPALKTNADFPVRISE